MKKFLESMLSQGGKVSHKRVIAVGITAVLAWAIVYAMLRASTAPERKLLIDGIMIFVLIMSGVATVPQIVSLVKGTPAPKEEENKAAE
jgi:small neutral amino acid transporter SnatA (MarC family)